MSETRAAEVVYMHRGKKSRVIVGIACPFCGCTVEAVLWSLAGSGKRCECRALLWRLSANGTVRAER